MLWILNIVTTDCNMYFGDYEDGNGIENKALFFISFKPDGTIQRVMY